MDKDALFTHAQKLFRSGLTTLVGSGASAAHGLPTMTELATYVLQHVGDSAVVKDLDGDEDAEWERIASELRAGAGLERAIRSEQMPAVLGREIAQHVAAAVQSAEATAIERMISSGSLGIFASLMEHLMKVDPSPSIVTTNYDRLIEVDLTLAGILVDSMFVGSPVAHFNANAAREEHKRMERAPGHGRTLRQTVRKHVRLSKPHGSLDWIEVAGGVVKTNLPASAPRRVIAPGGSKYRLGYESPFDEHRARANRAIDRATGFLVVGYGFNDEHLETRLRTVLPHTPSLIMARTLTTSAREVILSCSDAVGVELGVAAGSSRVVTAQGEYEVHGDYWQLEQLLREAI